MKLMNTLLKVPVYFYKICISPYTTSSCRFVPNCSSYAIDALNKLSTTNAIKRIIGRILRCNPFNKSNRLDRV